MEKFKIFDDNLVLFNSVLEDIRNAKQSIWIEIYRFGKDAMGEKFRMALEDKASEGLEVKILVDAWGTGADTTFFEPLTKLGAEVRIYRKMRLGKSFLSKNHCRNHRKLIVIDGETGYIGSTNITAYCLNWRELNLRTTDTACKTYRGNQAFYTADNCSRTFYLHTLLKDTASLDDINGYKSLCF